MGTPSSCRITTLATEFVYSVRLVEAVVLIEGGSLTVISLAGFSRGAYTARALAGRQGIIRYHIYILHLSLTPTRLAMQVVLLSKDNNREQIPFAYKLYKSTGSSIEALARGFKETFCRPVPIDFVGVWWVLMMSTPCGPVVKEIDRQGHGCERQSHNGRTLPFVNVNTTIRVFRQCFSLDEVCGGWHIFKLLT